MTSDMRVRWEYWVETRMTEKDANKLGSYGWELVAILEDGTIGWFKRPRAEFPSEDP
jgi:hypothetical protein